MTDTQVLIVGAGPIGLISALSLSSAGIRCALIDQRLDRLDAPKAHAVNPRTLEICHRLGVSANEVHRRGAHRDVAGQVQFVDVLNGTRFGSLPYERQDEDAKAHTPWPLVNISQPAFESMLSQQLTKARGVSLLRGLRAIELEQSADYVEVRFDANAFDEPIAVRAPYVIAADGAGSSIRSMLGIDMDGPDVLANNLMIHFESDLLALTGAAPGVLYFCLSPDASGAFLNYGRDNTWVFMHAFDPGSEQAEDFDSARCRAIVEAAAGVAVPDLVIRNVSPWQMSAQVAQRYREGRVFLAGDAAHRFPPTGGLGLNTGVGDAQNLAWKLAEVLQGRAGEALLDSYERERRPIAQTNTHQSLTNSARIFEVFGAVYGNDPTATADHYAAVCNQPSSFPAVTEAINNQRPHFDSFNLQIGYRYGNTVDQDSLDISRFETTFCVGDCLPHVALSSGDWLLGRLPMDSFALIAGPEGDTWDKGTTLCLREGVDIHPVSSVMEQAGLKADGALLIRPDGHIAKRWVTAPEDPSAAARDAIAQVLAGNISKEIS